MFSTIRPLALRAGVGAGGVWRGGSANGAGAKAKALPSALANVVSALRPAGLTPVYDDDFATASASVAAATSSNIVPLTPGAFRRGGMFAIPRSEAELPLLLETTPGPPDRDSSGLDFIDLHDFPAEEVAARLQDAATYLKLGCADGVPLRLATSPACRVPDDGDVGASSSLPLVAASRRLRSSSSSHAGVHGGGDGRSSSSSSSSGGWQQLQPASHTPQLLTPAPASGATAARTCSGDTAAPRGAGASTAAAAAAVVVAAAAPEATLSCSLATGFNVKKLTAFRDKVLRNVAPAVVHGYMEMARPVQEERRRRRLALLTQQRARIAAAAAGATAARDGAAATAAASSATAAMAAASSMASAIATAFGAGGGSGAANEAAGGSSGSLRAAVRARSSLAGGGDGTIAIAARGSSAASGVAVDVHTSGTMVRRFAASSSSGGSSSGGSSGGSSSGGSSPPPVAPSSAARAGLAARPAVVAVATAEALAVLPRGKPASVFARGGGYGSCGG